MAIKEPLLAKTVLGNTNLTLKADPGEAFMVKDILIRSAASSYVTVKIEKSLVGYFRTGGVFGSHITFRRGHARHGDRKSTRLNSSHIQKSRMPSSA